MSAQAGKLWVDLVVYEVPRPKMRKLWIDLVVTDRVPPPASVGGNLTAASVAPADLPPSDLTCSNLCPR